MQRRERCDFVEGGLLVGSDVRVEFEVSHLRAQLVLLAHHERCLWRRALVRPAAQEAIFEPDDDVFTRLLYRLRRLVSIYSL